ncbi:CAP domain-containing protein [Halobacillus yeomjeoni]|uniref:CAP domain-containing protein n=1 Tax=Halobacillus yeomjeoni TaxID=311194 RepID=UPI001CD506AB|nr:CAP domain-containing protein [Halobacillus yeomjeoni]MCA0984213.1 CAP domain-containing protein [Halobacillus yeomjeoni]
MKFKSLILAGATAFALLASPAASLASTDSETSVHVNQEQISFDQVVNWMNTNKLDVNAQIQSFDLSSFFEQFQVEQTPSKEKPEEKQDAVKEPKAEEQAEPQAEPKADVQQKQEMNQDAGTQTETNAEVSAFEKEVVELTNQERAKQGLSPLKLDTELSAVAEDKSLDMQQNNYFSHNSPTYGSPFDMMKAYGIDYRTAGENIAMGQTSPPQVVNGWMNSEGHRKNIMNPDFTHIGVGHVENGNYWTQMFIGK